MRDHGKMAMEWTIDGDESSWSEWASRMANSPASNLMMDWISKLEPGDQEWAVDIGCGSGRAFDLLRSKGYRVIGIDPIWEAAQACRKRTREDVNGAWPVLATAEHFPLQPESMQAMLAIGVLFHLGPVELENTLLEIRRVLRKGGEAIIHFLETGDWRQQIGRSTKPEELPKAGYKAVVTGFFQVETMLNLIELTGLTIKEQRLHLKEDEQGQRRDWFFRCIRKTRTQEMEGG